MLRRVGVVGLGYVGLPVAVAFARLGPVVGFDINAGKVRELLAGHDRTREIDAGELSNPNLILTNDESRLGECDFFIVTVPTPIDDANRPDMSAVIAASRAVGRHLKSGDIVVYESTVYPGATEIECVPVLEAVSGLRYRADFFVGYSPERVNPGDLTHRLETTIKVVSACDDSTLEVVAAVYGRVVKAGVHCAPAIAVAEAAKVIENTQRDINIALMNELALIFKRLDIDTRDVLAAAGTKWNFLPFFPGLVGGHCIGVDPYYLTHRAEQVGYHSEVILAGRRINSSMGFFVARETLRLLLGGAAWQMGGPPIVTVLGVTFKENVPDVRNTRCIDIVRELERFGVIVQVHDPIADSQDMQGEYGIALCSLEDLRPAQAVIVSVVHEQYRKDGWDLVTRCLAGGKGVVADVRSYLDRGTVPEGVVLWRL